MATKTSGGDLSEINVAVLAGGLGTRIRDVLGELPKVLAPLGNETLLDSQLRWLSRWRARRIILCLGVRHEAVVDHLARVPVNEATVVPSIESEPLGTAGAIALARGHLESDTVLVMNGDTLLDGDLGAFIDAHRACSAPCSILCVSVDDATRYGRILANSDDRVTGFEEKGHGGPGVVSAGAYLMQRAFLEERFAMAYGSLEQDIFPNALDGSVRAFVGDFRFLDIGTPESLERARSGAGYFVAASRQV